MTVYYLWSKILKKIRGSAIFHSNVHKTAKIESGSSVVYSTFGKHSFCGYDCEIFYCDIGSFCSIGNNVKIGGGMHPVEWVSTSPVFYEGRDSVRAKFSEHKRIAVERTIIGHDVWIGQGAMIKQGVKIGTGAVVGMGSIVTKDVDPYKIVAGSPAKVIKDRFDIQLANKLLKSKWWDLSDKELKRFAKSFNDPKKFIEEFSE